MSVCLYLPLVDTSDVSSTATLYKSLAQSAPEIKECVDACNFIAESTKQQNDIGSVSPVHRLAGSSPNVVTVRPSSQDSIN